MTKIPSGRTMNTDEHIERLADAPAGDDAVVAR